LCRDNATSHGENESVDATDAPNPNSTNNDGSTTAIDYQLSFLDREKYAPRSWAFKRGAI